MVKLANDEVIDLKETFRGKPSDALEYMCDGLLNQDKRKDFEIRMKSFGHPRGHMCYGCAATSTIQEIAGQNLTLSNIKNRQLLGFDPDELDEFETVIDLARMGLLDSLFRFCDVTEVGFSKWNRLWFMQDENWKFYIPTVRKAIREMRVMGF